MKDPNLIAYAELLNSEGFTIYEPSGHSEHFHYSRVVDGQECYGIVQSDRWNGGGRPYGGYSHSMPIKPSQENGSSMFVDGGDELTVEAAMKVARPKNRNDVVGTQYNYRDERFPLPAPTDYSQKESEVEL